MPIDPETGRWNPPTFAKREELRALCRQFKFVLANGPRYSSKTISAYHCIMDHAWNVPDANIVAITVSQNVGVDSGIWTDLTTKIIPDWIGGNFGMQWVKKPFIQGVSKKPTCQISNQYGGVATLQLESLSDEKVVETRFKPRRYSMIYVPELTTFRNRNTFNTWSECLRMIDFPTELHLFLADSNPPTATEQWISDLWWDLIEADEDHLEDYIAGHSDREFTISDQILEDMKKLKAQLCRVDFTIEDNVFADPEHVSQLKAKYSHNDELYRRYILGQRVQTTEGSLFVKVFRPGVHIVGEVSTPAYKDPEILVPEPNCNELICGWDPGNAKNSAAVIAERTYRMEKAEVNGKIVHHKVIILKFLDEHVRVGEHHSLEEFTIAFMKLMYFWEQYLGKVGKVIWRHWSDRSVFDTMSAESKRYYHEIIYEASARAIEDGVAPISSPIILQAADRSPGSLVQRVDLHQRLLFEDRLFYSAERCPKLISMNKSIKRGTTQAQVIQTGNPHKHVFDASSYLEASECYAEVRREVSNALGRKSSENRMVSIAI